MMNNRAFRKTLIVLLIIALLPAVLSVEASAASEISKSNGSFIVELWNGSAYEQMASISADEFQKEFKVNIGSMTTPKIRIRKAAEGLAFLDSVLLDGCAPSGNKKLQKTDFDVQEITTEGIVLRFYGNFDGNLSLTGRIEPKVIIGNPFMFPFDNTYIDDPQDFTAFFTYKLDSNYCDVQVDGQYQNLGEAFESRFLVPSTGHPNGYAYIYISNDDEYLYATADFTADNTFDYGEDFFKVFANVDGIVKEFKLSSNGSQYGVAAMQYTDKVSYEHMYYEMKIPLDQLGDTDDLQLAFSLYGTAAVSSATSDPASHTFTAGQTANGILRIYEVYDTITEVYYDAPGLTVQFQLSPAPVIQAGWYCDIPYTIQCTVPGDYNITVTGFETKNGTMPIFPQLQIPVQVNPAAVSITTQPASITVTEGQNAVFTVAAEGTTPYDYQWEKSSDSGSSWSEILGATTDTLTLNAVALSDDGTEYRCIVDNAANIPVTSDAATLTVTPLIIGLPDTYTMYTGGRVTWDPTPSGGTWNYDGAYFSATFNSPATFTALKEGTSTITYTAGGVSHNVVVTILKSDLPSTGQNFTWVYMLVLLFAVAMIAVLGMGRHKSKKNI